MKSLTIFSALAALASVSWVHGQEIAVNFNTEQNQSIQDITAATGVVSVDVADWNNINPQAAPLSGYIDDAGNTVAGFTLTVGTSGHYQTGVTSLGNLFNAYGDGFGNLTASNIPYAEYDVYVYVGSNGDGRTGTGTIGTETLGFTTASGTSGDDSSFTINSTPGSPVTYPSVNTLEFTDLTSSSFTYSQTQVSGGSNGVFGFEIVAVPEPSTYAMMGLSLLALVGIRRIRQLS